jgi:hypothetical protein
MNLTRRTLLSALACSPAMAVAAPVQPIIVYRDPGCSCCVAWGGQVRKGFGRLVQFVDSPARAALQKRLGVPASLSSCHTALINGLVFEGHVPVADMKLAMLLRPAGVRGLAVPDMPIGSPGMEAPGTPAEHYAVMAFGSGAPRVFARH